MKTKRLLALSSLLLLIASCSPYTINPEDKVTVVDMQERTVEIDRNRIDRVVCVGAGALRFYSYVGDLNKLVGVEQIDSEITFSPPGQAVRPYYTANKEFFSTLPIIGKGGPASQVPEKEKIAVANPNIIVSFYSDVGVNNQLQNDLKVPVIALAQGKDGIFDEVTIKSFELLGNVFKRTDRVNQLKNYINNAKSEFEAIPSVTEDKYYVGCVANWGSADVYSSNKNFPVFTYAKAKNAITSDAESLVSVNPEHVFIDTFGLAGFVAAYKENQTVFTSLKAFENDEVYALLPYNAYYTNLEIQLMSTYYVASIAHPENFPNFNLDNKMNEILNAFLGKSIYNELKNHPLAYGGYQKLNIENLVK